MTVPGSRCEPSKGFTLLEVLVAMVLTGSGILCFGGLLATMGRIQAEDTWATRATFCAQERMEELRFSFITGEGPTTDGEETLTAGPYRQMRRQWSTEDSSDLSGMMEIKVACDYPWRGNMKRFELSTLLFEGE